MKEIVIETLYDIKLAAYLWEPGDQEKHTVVICHGFRGTKENGGKLFGFADKLRNTGMGVLAFDFRGSGKSDGEFSSVTLSRQGEDVQAVIDYICREYGSRVILLGRSMGGSSVLAGASADKRVDAFIFWSTPVFMHQAFATIMGTDYDRLRVGESIYLRDDGGEFRLDPDLISDFDSHDMEQYVRAIGTRPTLIIQARDDDAVSAENGQYLHRNLPNGQLAMFDQAGHRFLELTAQREDITTEWLRQHFCV